jgi:formate hydrogenlyase subunit 3/multisubunit Na+/H+ antiporter MnhD subunit
MTDWMLYLWVVLGVLLSVLVPVFMKWLREFTSDLGRGSGDVAAKVWLFARPYVKLAVASSVIGLLALAIYRAGFSGDKIVLDTWAKALLFGYVWDSTFQKALTGIQASGDGSGLQGNRPRAQQQR